MKDALLLTPRRGTSKVGRAVSSLITYDTDSARGVCLAASKLLDKVAAAGTDPGRGASVDLVDFVVGDPRGRDVQARASWPMTERVISAGSGAVEQAWLRCSSVFEPGLCTGR